VKDIKIGHATYRHKVTGKTYALSFNLLPFETELSKAWDLVSLAARRNGWIAADVAVKVGAK
jgi:hypothetical protein